jgi:predicted enzyme related to lactoylglutathione lyase
VIYPAPDLSAAKAWWTAFVGQARYFDEPFYVGFSLGGYELGLLSDADPSDGAQVYWGVDDVADTVAAAVAAGAEVVSPPADVGGDIVTATVRLPDGSLVGFIFNPHFTLV